MKKITIGPEPIAMKAGDERILINGEPCRVDFRVISEDLYQYLVIAAREAGVEVS